MGIAVITKNNEEGLFADVDLGADILQAVFGISGTVLGSNGKEITAFGLHSVLILPAYQEHSLSLVNQLTEIEKRDGTKINLKNRPDLSGDH